MGNDCEKPGTCMPSKGGPVGNDGHECPMHCPAACNDQHEMSCYGGKDWNGCQNPDFCAPTKQPPGFDGNDCPGFCPTQCDGDDLHCPGGQDANGCEMPATCMPSKGGPVGLDGNECVVTCP